MVDRLVTEVYSALFGDCFEDGGQSAEPVSRKRDKHWHFRRDCRSSCHRIEEGTVRFRPMPAADLEGLAVVPVAVRRTLALDQMVDQAVLPVRIGFASGLAFELDQFGQFTPITVEHGDDIIMCHTGEIAVAAKTVGPHEKLEAGKPGDEDERLR